MYKIVLLPIKKLKFMRRRRTEKRELVTYTLSTNQGTPDVYVNNVYIGTVDSNGKLSWTVPEYYVDETISLKNMSMPPSVKSRGAHGLCGGVRGTFYGEPNSSFSTSLSGYAWDRVIDYEENSSAILKKGSTNIRIDAIPNEYEESIWCEPVTLSSPGASNPPSANWDGILTFSGNTFTVKYASNPGARAELRVIYNYKGRSQSYGYIIFVTK